MILPSILENSLKEIQEKIAKVDSVAEKVHLDIGDGMFVESKTFVDLGRIPELECSVPIQVHLMVKNPVTYIQEIKGVENYIVHVEEIRDTEIFMLGQRISLAINYNTPLQALLPYLSLVEFVQFMSVKPGKQGNAHISDTYSKVEAFKKLYPRIKTQIDGGINASNIESFCKLNVDGIVIGSEIFNTKEPASALKEFIALEKNFKGV